jgi:hypothetical protein
MTLVTDVTGNSIVALGRKINKLKIKSIFTRDSLNRIIRHTCHYLSQKTPFWGLVVNIRLMLSDNHYGEKGLVDLTSAQ